MRNKVVKNIAVIGAVTLALTGINASRVSAEWIQNENSNTWSWMENDSMVTGWKLIDGSWYYFNDDGTMYVGWLQDNNKWYKLNDNGSMVTGWILDNGKWYYANPSGDLETGRLTIDGKTYNFLSDGTMIESEQAVDFSNNNVLASSTSIPEKDQEQQYRDDKGTGNGKDDKDTDNKNDQEIKDESYKSVQKEFIPRTSKPDLDDKHYYSNDNIFYRVKLSPPFTKSDGTPIKGNCTWYTWGRAWESTGIKPVEAGFTGNAYEWWQANKSSGKYQYGTEPRVGAVAVWKSSLPGSGGCGHVAVVEKIEDGKVYISESMWHGDCFAYKEIYSTQYLYGYIYLDEPNY